MVRAREATIVAAAGALMGGLTGKVLGVGRWGAAVGVASGAIAGYRGIYDWRSRSGVTAFVVDHTWALATTCAGVVVTAANSLGDPGYMPELSQRQNRMVNRRGVVLRRGFAVTFGNVVNGAADVDGRFDDSRHELVTVHEEAHIRQARYFGPIFPMVYGAWFAGGALVGLAQWLRSDRRESLTSTIDRHAYYANPFERHAYKLQGVSTPLRAAKR